MSPPKKAMKKQDLKRKGRGEWKQIREVEDFRNQMLADKRSPGTIKQYTSIIYRFLYWIDKKPRKIQTDDLERYKAFLAIEKESAKNTIYINIKAIQAFYKYLGIDTVREVKPPKRPGSLPKYLNEEEMGRLFDAVKKDEFNGKRDHAMLLVLGYTGLRVSELTNLDVEDVDFSEKTIRVRSGKGDKDRIVIFEENTGSALRDHLKDKERHIAKEESGALFASAKKKRISVDTVEKLIKKYAEKANISKNVTPHVLRHTMATTLLKHGADIRIIQQLLGHSSISTTQIYTHVDEHMLKKTYSKAKPKYE